MLDIKMFSKTFIVEEKNTPVHQAHPLLKLIGTIILFVAIFMADIFMLLIILIIETVEAVIGRVLKNILSFIWGIKSFLILIAIVSLLLYSPPRAISIILRIIDGTIIIILFVITTNHTKLMMALEQIHVPSSIIMGIQLALRSIPLISKDAEEATEALILRRELRVGFPIRGITTLLAVIILSAIERAECLAEALTAKYFGATKKRTYITEIKYTPYSIIQVAIKIMLLALIIYMPLVAVIILNKAEELFMLFISLFHTCL
ncbi:MAG: energy-coupling factor transporter transmembrane protein EcfT [Candidatus Njordarchaeota archaeon]